MRNSLEVAAVSATLRALLAYAVNEHNALANELGGDVAVTIGPPVCPTESIRTPILNLYLFRLTQSTWPQPAETGFQGGETMPVRPPIGIALHYLISVHGGESLASELLLGRVIAALHETPVLGQELMRSILSHPIARGTSELVHSYVSTRNANGEQLRVTPLTLTIEETAQFWTALQVPLTPAVFYTVSTVCI